MKIIILAAGKGERLKPLTQNTPKPLLVTGSGKTLLEEQLDRMRDSKVISEVILVIGYLADQIEAKIKTYANRGLKIRTLFNPFYSISNNFVSLWLARGEMGQDFFIANGDCIFSPNIYKQMFKECEDGIFLCAKRKKSFDDDDMKICIDKGAVVRVSKELEKRKSNAESPGIALVRGNKCRKIFLRNLDELLRDKRYLNKFWLEVFNHMAEKGVSVHPWFMDAHGKWQEVDFHMDIKHVKSLLRVKDV